MAEALKIAVADDEVDMRDYFQKILPRLGHEVVAVASDGQELLDRCRQLHPDLVITDIRMPELDGLAASRQIAKEMAIPILLITAHEPPLASGDEDAIVLLTKPINQEKLEKGIAEAMQRTRQS